MIVRSSKITQYRTMLPEFEKMLGAHLKSVKQNYFRIYLENSHKKRFIFFCEPLIQHLWSIFREMQSYQLGEYLEDVKKQT